MIENTSEVRKFDILHQQWWDKRGPMGLLHRINPPRLSFIQHTFDVSSKRVLDLGCGGGILSEQLALDGAVVTGVDASRSSIEVAKAHAEKSGLSIEYCHGSIDIVKGRQFDAIVCMEMLEHVDEPEAFIAQFVDLLVEDGQLFLSTIHRNWKSYALAIVAAEYMLGLLPKQTHDYTKFIRPSELAAALRSCGYIDIASAGMYYNPLTGRAGLTDDVSVNYLMRARRM